MNALNDNFGTQADLQALSKALHDRGMVGSPFLPSQEMGCEMLIFS